MSEHVATEVSQLVNTRLPLISVVCFQGDSISLQYTGTGSVFSSQIKQGGKSSLSSNIDHALKSIGRLDLPVL